MRSLVVTKAGGTPTVADRVRVADRFWARARGLLGRPPLRQGEGLLLQPCRAVHTFGLGYPIDVAFLDRGGTVLAAYHGLEPNRHTGWYAAAACALELPSGTLERTALSEGERLWWNGTMDP